MYENEWLEDEFRHWHANRGSENRSATATTATVTGITITVASRRVLVEIAHDLAGPALRINGRDEGLELTFATLHTI